MTSEYTSRGQFRGPHSPPRAHARAQGPGGQSPRVVGAVALITGEAAAFLSFFAGCMTLRHGITAPALRPAPVFLRADRIHRSQPQPDRPVSGLGLGAIIRHTAAAITVVVRNRLRRAGPLNLAIQALPADLHSQPPRSALRTPLCRPRPRRHAGCQPGSGTRNARRLRSHRHGSRARLDPRLGEMHKPPEYRLAGVLTD